MKLVLLIKYNKNIKVYLYVLVSILSSPVSFRIVYYKQLLFNTYNNVKLYLKTPNLIKSLVTNNKLKEAIIIKLIILKAYYTGLR